MKKIILLSFCVFSFIHSFAQTDIYAKMRYEMIFSIPQLDAYNSNKGKVTRFSPWLNIEENVNFDINDIIGFNIGVSIKNIGFIYKISNPSNIDASYESKSIKKKFRTYNLGIPVGIKFGNLEKFFFYGGYELEFPMNYKEKTFIDNNKTRYNNEWFSNKTPDLVHSVYFGIEFPYELGIKVKYYITEFFDANCTELVRDIPTIQYNQLHSHVLYLSLTFNILKNTKFPFISFNTKRNKENIYYY